MTIPSDPPQEDDPRDDTTPHAGGSLPGRPAPEAGSNGDAGAVDETVAGASTRDAETDSGSARHHVNPARMEVRVRRIALIGLILVPVIYFVVQSLR